MISDSSYTQRDLPPFDVVFSSQSQSQEEAAAVTIAKDGGPPFANEKLQEEFNTSKSERKEKIIAACLRGWNTGRWSKEVSETENKHFKQFHIGIRSMPPLWRVSVSME